jgi:hypothetical protein
MSVPDHLLDPPEDVPLCRNCDNDEEAGLCDACAKEQHEEDKFEDSRYEGLC